MTTVNSPLTDGQLRRLGTTVEIPCILLFVYGISSAFRSGGTWDARWHSYVPLVLGIVSLFAAVGYRMTLLRTERSLRNAGCTFAGLLPYLAGCYMFFFLGVYGIYHSFVAFASLTLVRSLAFGFLGWKTVNGMYTLSEIAKTGSVSKG